MREGKSEGRLGKHQQHCLELQLLIIRKGKRYSNPNSKTICRLSRPQVVWDFSRFAKVRGLPCLSLLCWKVLAIIC